MEVVIFNTQSKKYLTIFTEILILFYSEILAVFIYTNKTNITQENVQNIEAKLVKHLMFSIPQLSSCTVMISSQNRVHPNL